MLVGHLPHLHVLAAALGVTVSADVFAPAGGVLFETHGTGAWALAHHVQSESAKKSWWIHGVSQYVRAEVEEGGADYQKAKEAAQAEAALEAASVS